MGTRRSNISLLPHIAILAVAFVLPSWYRLFSMLCLPTDVHRIPCFSEPRFPISGSSTASVHNCEACKQSPTVCQLTVWLHVPILSFHLPCLHMWFPACPPMSDRSRFELLLCVSRSIIPHDDLRSCILSQRPKCIYISVEFYRYFFSRR